MICKFIKILFRDMLSTFSQTIIIITLINWKLLVDKYFIININKIDVNYYIYIKDILIDEKADWYKFYEKTLSIEYESASK